MLWEEREEKLLGEREGRGSGGGAGGEGDRGFKGVAGEFDGGLVLRDWSGGRGLESGDEVAPEFALGNDVGEEVGGVMEDRGGGFGGRHDG